MVSRCGAAPLPRRDRIYSPAGGSCRLPDPEPALGDDPRSPPYQSGALPLCYAGEMVDSLGHDPNTLSGYALLSRQARQPHRLCCPWRSAEESNPLPVRYVCIPVFRTGGRPFSRNAPYWCPRQELNLHAQGHEYLELARLPFRHADELVRTGRFELPKLRGLNAQGVPVPNKATLSQSGAGAGDRTQKASGLSRACVSMRHARKLVAPAGYDPSVTRLRGERPAIERWGGGSGFRSRTEQHGFKGRDTRLGHPPHGSVPRCRPGFSRVRAECLSW